jgi:diacylglycerol kinase family enzyme
MKIIVFINRHARNGQAEAKAQEIEQAFAALGQEVTMAGDTTDLIQAAKTARSDGYDVLVAAGGDGTIRAVAAAVISDGGSLGVIPLGTFNHFAKDLGIPLDVPGAVAAIAQGTLAWTDAIMVNDELFLNSASLGIHPLFVRKREQYEDRIGKWAAIPVAMVITWARFRPFEVGLAMNNETRIFTTPFVFVGSNEYQLDQIGLGKKETRQSGKLWLYVVYCKNRWQFSKIAMRTLLGKQQPDSISWAGTSEVAEIELNKRQPTISLDGETVQLKTPLKFSVLARKLPVLVAKSPSASGR